MEDNELKTEVEQRLDGDGDAGGGAAAEAELKAAEAALEAEHDDEDGETGNAKTEDGHKPSRLQRRIQRLVEARKSYERYGKPEDLERKLAKLAEYEQLERRIQAEQRAKAERQREESGDANVGRKFRGYTDKAYPNIPNAAERIERMLYAEDERAHREAVVYAKTGRDHIVSILKENGIPTEDPAVVQAYEHTMATFIGENQDLHARYVDPNTQRASLEDSFRFAASRLLNPILAAAGAGTYEQLAARKARALGSGRGSSAGAAIDIADEKPPKNATPDQIHEFHKRRASRAWDLALDADEASAS